MREYTATVKLDRQKRITIPKAIRDKENLKPGDVVEVTIEGLGTLRNTVIEEPVR